MGRAAASLLTVVLALCFLILVSARGGNDASRAGAFPPLLAVAILWVTVLWDGMPAGVKVPALVVFFLILVAGAVLPAFQVGMKAAFDRPRAEAPVTLAGGTRPVSAARPAAGSVAIVYHPGGSDDVRTAVTALGKRLAADGLTVAVFTAGPKLRLDKGKYRAIILGSPVYSGEVRPPVLDFLAANSPLAAPVFAVLTGWFPGMKEQDLGRLSTVVSRAGGRLVTGGKIGSGSTAVTADAELSSVEGAVLGALRGAAGRN